MNDFKQVYVFIFTEQVNILTAVSIRNNHTKLCKIYKLSLGWQANVTSPVYQANKINVNLLTCLDSIIDSLGCAVQNTFANSRNFAFVSS